MVGKVSEKLRESAQGTTLPVHLVPGSSKFAVEGFDEWTGSLKVKVSSPREKGKANRELVEKLERLFNAETRIVRGKKSRKKTLLVKASRKKLLERIPR